MRAILLSHSSVIYKEIEMPRLTSLCNVLVKVCYAGICRTDIGVARGNIPAKNNVVLGHEFCGRIVGFSNGATTMDEWTVGDTVSANPMMFGDDGDLMCGKDCDGAFAEYIAAPAKALIRLSSQLVSPLGAYLEPVAAALAPMKFVDKESMKRICVFGNNRIAELTCQVAKVMGFNDIEHLSGLERLKKDHYDCIIETEPEHIDAYINALKPGGTLIMKSRSFATTSFTSNAIAMKEICIQGARYGDFHMARQILEASPSIIDTKLVFGKTFELSDFKEAFAEAELPQSKKIFFKICAE